jgi:aspartyl-tRNA(Asn)/glutamyl-tRNA(Gln) amidotransferase subunit C
MSVTKENITKVAMLARIRVGDEEIPKVTERINQILALVDRMQQVNTDGIEPLANPHDAVQRLREDVVTCGNQREQLLLNAPSAENGLFLVPRVIE